MTKKSYTVLRITYIVKISHWLLFVGRWYLVFGLTISCYLLLVTYY